MLKARSFFAVLAVTSLVLMAGGCDLVNLDDEVTAADRRSLEADSVEVINKAGEDIQVYPLEYSASQRGYWSWPGDPSTVAVRTSSTFALSDVHAYEPGLDTLYISLRARRSHGEDSGDGASVDFRMVGHLVVSPESLDKSSYRVVVGQSDFTR